MGDNTGIAWTDATWNPVTGCSKVSAGCKHCYAERVFPRAYHADRVPAGPHGVTRPRRFTEVRCHPERLDQPLRWRRPRRVFVNSMSDLFHPEIPYEFVREVFNVMRIAKQHTFQVLTKRPERMRDFALTRKLGYDPNLPIGHVSGIPPNVWLGVSAEDQATARERIPVLLRTPASKRFLSAEPLLGPMNLCQLGLGQGEGYTDALRGRWVDGGCFGETHALDWVIVGGESGPKARSFDLDWGRSIVAQCREAGVPVFVKQLGRAPMNLGTFPTPRHRAGADPSEWPVDLRVQEWPS